MSKDDQNGKPQADGDEAEEECGFCIFMKGGGCKESFTNWSKCVDEHREGSKDFTEECKDATLALQDCMLEHKDYYKDFIGLADGAEGDKSGEQKKGDQDKKGDSNTQNKEDGDDKQDKAKQPDSKDSNGKKAGEGQEKPNEKADNSKDEGSKSSSDSKSDSNTKGADPNTSARLDDTPAQKHNKAAEDSESKQARTHEQETNPVKAKPDAKKKDEAANKPPRPEREENKQQAEEEAEKSAGDEDKGAGDKEEEEEEEEDDTPHIVVQTAPYDRRFVTTNQARHCYTRYQEYHRCVAQRGEDDKDCSFFQKAYRAICPGDWVDNWNEQREEGTFPGRW